MNGELKIGMTAKAEILVSQNETAKNVGSGSLEVFATPMMVALMEQSALKCVQPYLADGQSTVGTKVDISHIDATPVGMKVYAQAELKTIDNRKLTFHVVAYDEKGKIGEGMHERFIIDASRFMQKVSAKIGI